MTTFTMSASEPAAGRTGAKPASAAQAQRLASCQMPVLSIAADRISDWESFHDVFAEALGFPSYYGRNMNAWIDCLTSADDAGGDLVGADVVAGSGDVLTLQIENAADFAQRCPEQYEALIECSAFVNWRRVEVGERPILALSFYK